LPVKVTVTVWVDFIIQYECLYFFTTNDLILREFR